MDPTVQNIGRNSLPDGEGNLARRRRVPRPGLADVGRSSPSERRAAAGACATIGQRLVQFVLVFVIVTFTVMAAPGSARTDPARDLAGGAVSEAQIEQVKEDYPYLDEPLPCSTATG